MAWALSLTSVLPGMVRRLNSRGLLHKILLAVALVEVVTAAPNLATQGVVPLGGVLQQDVESCHMFGGSALTGMVRCHKCLFSDEEVRNGDVVFLLRGADSHHRYLTPLELEINGNNLPGREISKLFYEHQKDALNYASQGMGLQRGEQGGQKCKANGMCTAGEVSDAATHVMDDLSRFQRLLQYAIAANTSEGWIRPDAWDFNVAMYKATNLNLDTLIKGIQRLREFYQTKVKDSAAWHAQAEPQFLHLIEKLYDAQRIQNNKIPLNPSEANRAANMIGSATLRLNGRPITLERPPEIKVPSVLVDPRTIDISSLPESERAAFSDVLRNWKQ